MPTSDGKYMDKKNAGTMTRRIAQAVACLFLLTFGVGVWVVLARPFESPRDKALRLCGECGLDVSHEA